ncbi:MAG: hypothetical protein KGJ13_10945 [Patescibacteria group bacterium]|nr:hypothetical protein [Patescibacteria group bacterium]
MTPLKLVLYLVLGGLCWTVIMSRTNDVVVNLALIILVIASMWFGAVTEKSN